MDSIVQINAYGHVPNYVLPFQRGDRAHGVGTGFFVAPPSNRDTSEFVYILTCAHCVADADTVTVTLPQQGKAELAATVLAFVPPEQLDMAVLAVPDPEHKLQS